MTEEIRAKIGRPSPRNKGGWILRTGSRGYMRVPVPREERHLHPTVDARGYIARSHYVWNVAHPDDPVRPGQTVHHVNGDSLDDRPNNLERCESQSDHWKRFHASGIAATRQRDSAGRFC
jgi:hypothetical protein